MRSFSVSPIEMFASLWRNRELIKASAKREVLGAIAALSWASCGPSSIHC